MTYVGMERATALINTSLPPWDNIFSFQIRSLCHTLSFIYEKSIRFDFPTIEGRPRYLFYCWVTLVCQIVDNSAFVLCPTFRLNTFVVFTWLILWPEDFPYMSSTFWISWFFFLFTLQNIILSSTKRRWFTWGVPQHIFIPCIRLLTMESLNKLTNHSVHNKKR